MATLVSYSFIYNQIGLTSLALKWKNSKEYFISGEASQANSNLNKRVLINRAAIFGG